MTQSLNRLKESPSQTAGPYVHIGCAPNFVGIHGVYEADLGNSMVTDQTKGERITIRGSVIDGTGTPLRDALVEIWQADASGLFASVNETRGTADPAFTGFGRQPADRETGEFVFETIKPGAVPLSDGRLQAPHIVFWIVARGINLGLTTRMYFPDEQKANDADPILAGIELRTRVPTLIADKLANGEYRFDIRLQGEGETIFFDV